MAWWMTEHEFLAAIDLHGNPSAAARMLGGIKERRAREIAKILDVTGNFPASSASSSDDTIDARASAEITDTTAVLISAANPRGTDMLTPEEMLLERGLDPDEWDFKVSGTSYDALAGDGKITTLHRIRVDAVRRPEALVPIFFSSDWRPQKPRRARRPKQKPRVVPHFPDPHFPMHEPALYEASLAWLDEFNPDELVLLGDLSDASPFKRHRKNPRTDVTVPQHVGGTYEGLAGWRGAAPNTKIRALRGNHDAWMAARVLEMFPAFAELVRPGEDMPLLSMRSVLNLDSLHIETIESSGEYHDEVFEIFPDLVAMHGVKAGVNGAVKEFDAWEATSIIQGHAHKLQITAICKRLARGGSTQRYAINGGTMGRRDLGYDHKHDVAQGWVVFVQHACGSWIPELVTFDPQTETTMFREWIYKP